MNPSALFVRARGFVPVLHGGFALAGLVWLAGPGQATAEFTGTMNSNAEASIEYEEGLVSIHGRGASLGHVLTALGRIANFKVYIANDLQATVRSVLVNVPLEKAVRRLIGDITAVMVHTPHECGDCAIRLIEVRLYPKPHRVTELIDSPTGESAGSVAELRQLLGDFESLNPADQMRVIKDLRMIEEPQATVALLEIALSDGDLKIRRDAASGLQDLPSDRAASALGIALKEAESTVRMRAVRLFGKIATDKGFELLADALVFDPDYRVRRAVLFTLTARAMTTVGDPEDIEALVRAASISDDDAGVRRSAAMMLKNIATKSSKSD